MALFSGLLVTCPFKRIKYHDCLMKISCAVAVLRFTYPTTQKLIGSVPGRWECTVQLAGLMGPYIGCFLSLLHLKRDLTKYYVACAFVQKGQIRARVDVAIDASPDLTFCSLNKDSVVQKPRSSRVTRLGIGDALNSSGIRATSKQLASNKQATANWLCRL